MDFGDAAVLLIATGSDEGDQIQSAFGFWESQCAFFGGMAGVLICVDYFISFAGSNLGCRTGALSVHSDGGNPTGVYGFGAQWYAGSCSSVGQNANPALTLTIDATGQRRFRPFRS
jgi:hypothetical protein